MSDRETTRIIISTSIVALLTGFLFGVYTIRGYIISPGLTEERRANFNDPVESEESDVDEDDTILDHAPNWENGEEADRRQGLRARAQAAPAAARPEPIVDATEECKLVLVVRTDLGMTKGIV
jgi:PTH2 family peptidyl-tRNA hydrolase